MQNKEQEYAKTSFQDVANKYDEIPFFKISARHVAQIIHTHKDDERLDILDVACGTGNVVLECASCIFKAQFDAVDISEGMLAKAQDNANKKNLTNIEFHLQDITKLFLEKFGLNRLSDMRKLKEVSEIIESDPSLGEQITVFENEEGAVNYEDESGEGLNETK